VSMGIARIQIFRLTFSPLNIMHQAVENSLLRERKH
jgi:hypothetical protein